MRKKKRKNGDSDLNWVEDRAFFATNITWMWYEFFIETIKKEIRKRRQSTQKNIKGNKSSLLHPPGLEA